MNTKSSLNTSKRTLQLLWVSLTLCIILLLANFLPVTPNDYWWYVRLGSDILHQGSIPQADTYSWTITGSPIHYFSCLSAVLFKLLDAGGGITLTVLARALCLGVFYGLVWLCSVKMGSGPRAAALFTLLAALAGSNNWVVRPQMFAYPLFGLILWLLIDWQSGRIRYLWLLPLAAVLWINLHGSFLLLFALSVAALLLGKGPKKPLLIATVCAFLATWLNPRGPLAWIDNAGIILNPSLVNANYILEWSPPVLAGWQNWLFFSSLLVFPILAAASKHKLTRMEWLWFLGFGFLALSGLRYVIWFTVLMGIFTSVLFSAWVKTFRQMPEQKIYPIVNLSISAVLLLVPLAMLPGVRQRWWPSAPPSLSEETPVLMVEWLKSNPDLEGPIWNDMAFGSYLIHALPERLVWIDTRVFPFPSDQWETYTAINDAQPGWEALLEASGARLVLVNRATQPILADGLSTLPEWQLLYEDQAGFIYQRR